MPILPLDLDDPTRLEELLSLSRRAARINHPRWLQEREKALSTLRDAARPEGVARVLEEDGRAVGWIAAAPTYPGQWKLHPLLVDPDFHGRGYGRRLVAELEREVRDRGARLMIVTTADATGATTLSGRDLFPELPGALTELAPRPGSDGHAVFFWQRVGYTLTGVVPDSGGEGIPSLQLVKRLRTDTLQES